MTTSKPAISYTLTTGTQSANTFAETRLQDGIEHSHTDDTGDIDIYYEHVCGVPNAQCVEVFLHVRVAGNVNNVYNVYAWNWGATTWERIGDLGDLTPGAPTPIMLTARLLGEHTGTGADEGKARIRVAGTSLAGTVALHIDQILVGCNVVAITIEDALVEDLSLLRGLLGNRAEITENPDLSRDIAVYNIAGDTIIATYHIDPTGLLRTRTS